MKGSWSALEAKKGGAERILAIPLGTVWQRLESYGKLWKLVQPTNKAYCHSTFKL